MDLSMDTRPAPERSYGERGTWMRCVDGYEFVDLHVVGRCLIAKRRTMDPDGHELVRAEVSRTLVRDVRHLFKFRHPWEQRAHLLDDEEGAWLNFCNKYGLPVRAPGVDEGRWLIPLHQLRDEVRTLFCFEQRWGQIGKASNAFNNYGEGVRQTMLQRQMLARDVLQYLQARGVAFTFEVLPSTGGLVPRLGAGSPFASALLRIIQKWSHPEEVRSGRQCYECGVPMSPDKRRDARYCSVSCQNTSATRRRRARRAGLMVGLKRTSTMQEVNRDHK